VLLLRVSENNVAIQKVNNLQKKVVLTEKIKLKICMYVVLYE